MTEIVAEIGQAHDGSLFQAHAFIDAVASAGADVAKFQCHYADLERDEWLKRPQWADESRRAYWRRMEFTPEEWRELARHTEDMGLEFLCTPFSLRAVETLEPLVRRWKVSSGKVKDQALVEALVASEKPIIASTGMSTEEEEAEIATWADLLLQCSSHYPAAPDSMGLDLIPDWYDGLSDHSGTIWPGLAVAGRGGLMVEVHVCWSREQGGPDVAASLTMTDLSTLVQGVRFIDRCLEPVDKTAQAQLLAGVRDYYMGQG